MSFKKMSTLREIIANEQLKPVGDFEKFVDMIDLAREIDNKEFREVIKNQTDVYRETTKELIAKVAELKERIALLEKGSTMAKLITDMKVTFDDNQIVELKECVNDCYDTLEKRIKRLEGAIVLCPDTLEKRIKRLEGALGLCPHELILWDIQTSDNQTNQGGGAVIEFERIYKRLCADVRSASKDMGTKPGYIRCDIKCQSCGNMLTFHDIDVEQRY